MRLLFLLLLCPFSAYSQSLKVADKATERPLEDVVVRFKGGDLIGFTGHTGQLQLPELSASDTLVLSLLGYQTQQFSHKQLVEAAFSVQLKEVLGELQEVSVAASRWSRSSTGILGDVVTLNSADIEAAAAPTTADLLTRTGEVFVQKSQHGGGSPMLRGFAANKVLLVFDGIRMNNAIYRSGNLQNVLNIDPNVLERAEVLLGPGSVIYGSDALGGVMYFQSRQLHTNTSESKYNVSTEFNIRRSWPSFERTVSSQFQLSAKKWAIFLSGTSTNLGDVVGGKNFPSNAPDFGKQPFVVIPNVGQDSIAANPEPWVQRPSGYTLAHFYGKALYQLNDKVKLTAASYHSRTSDTPRFDRLSQLEDDGLPRYAEWYYGPQRWQLHWLRADIGSESRLFSAATLVLAKQNYRESRHDRRFNQSRLRSQYEEVDIWTFNADFTAGSPKASLTYGLEAGTNEVASTATAQLLPATELQPFTPRYPDGGSSYSYAALYAVKQWPISATLSAQAGARFTYNWLSSTTTDSLLAAFLPQQLSLENGAPSASFSLVRQQERQRFNFTLGTGFRSPNVDDVGKFFEISNEQVQVPNPGLGPEYVASAEVGWQRAAQNLQLGATLWYNRLFSAMVRQPYQLNTADSVLVDGQLLLPVALQNTGAANSLGANAQLRYKLPYNLQLLQQVAWSWGAETDGTPLRHIPPLFGQTTLRYAIKRLKVRAIADYNLRKPLSEIPEVEWLGKPQLYHPELGAPGWFTIGLSSSFQLDENIEVQAQALNLLDRHYRTYSSGISAQGRTFSFTGRFRL